MPALPAVSDFTGADRTNAQMKITHAALHAYLVGLLGVDGVPATALAALGALLAPGVTTRTAATTLVAADRGRLIQATSGSWALTLPAAAAAGAGWAVLALNSGTGTITLTRAGSDLIDGAASVALAPGMAVLVLGTGSGWVTLTLGGAASAGRGLRASDLQTSATDAAAGRVLTAGAFGLGVTGNAPVLANLDDSTAASGLYRSLQGTTTGTFPPTSVAGQNGHILYHRNLAGTVWQVYAPAGAAGAGFANMMFTRQFSGGTWGPWTRSYAQNNVLGTVTQDAGVPTGALIESGSNANGRWRRFACGFQMCWRDQTGSASAATTWTFPAAFIDVPRVTGTVIATVLSAVCLDAAATTTAATWSARDKADARRADTANLLAVGRWF